MCCQMPLSTGNTVASLLSYLSYYLSHINLQYQHWLLFPLLKFALVYQIIIIAQNHAKKLNLISVVHVCVYVQSHSQV